MKIEQIVQVKYHELNQNELYIWNYILHHKSECEDISIQDLAGYCNVSHTTILRFVKKLGFRGYSDFKHHLRWEQQDDCFNSNELELCCHEITKNAEMIRDRDCSDVFRLLDKSRRTFLYGTGETQINAAKELKRCFSVTHRFLHLIEGHDEIITLAEQSESDDLFIIFSVSGENEMLSELIKQIKETGAKIIAFTYGSRNPLSMASDIHIAFQTHDVHTRDNTYDIRMVSHFSIGVELLFLKYLEYLG